jgi:hypothetical protein
MTTKKHPRELTAAETEAMIAAFDSHSDDEYSVTDAAMLSELRAAAAERREAEGRIEAAALAAHRAGLSWGTIGRATWHDPPRCTSALRATRPPLNQEIPASPKSTPA